MTVAELIERLKKQPQDAAVHLAYPSGDYWRTTLAVEAKRVEFADAFESKYHGLKALAREESTERTEEILVIR